MFKPLNPDAPTVTVTIDDRAVAVPAGLSVAAAMLCAGVDTFRTTPVSGAPRGPYCLMGACFDCLVVIDGVQNRQACMVDVVEGMRIRRQHGARDPASE
jgi:predicted molibdopterin-dependent oxidoreductase YjgC